MDKDLYSNSSNKEVMRISEAQSTDIRSIFQACNEGTTSDEAPVECEGEHEHPTSESGREENMEKDVSLDDIVKKVPPRPPIPEQIPEVENGPPENHYENI